MSALLNWFKLVYGPFGQINTLDLISANTATGLEGIECTKAEVLLSNLYTVFEPWNPSFYSPSPKFRDCSNKIWTRNTKWRNLTQYKQQLIEHPKKSKQYLFIIRIVQVQRKMYQSTKSWNSWEFHVHQSFKNLCSAFLNQPHWMKNEQRGAGTYMWGPTRRAGMSALVCHICLCFGQSGSRGLLQNIT